MNKKVLIRKQAGGVQQFQEIGGRRGPSFMGLARRLNDPTASGWQKVLAGAGMAGKVAAGIGAANQTLHQMHGGNAFAPLNLGYTYQGLDPTSGMERDATLGEQQDSMARNDVRQRSNQTLSNLHQQGYNVRDLASGARTYNLPPADLATPPTSGVPPNHPGFVPASQPAAQPAQPAVQPAVQPTNTAASVSNNLGIETPALSNELVQATANTSVPTAAPATAAPATTQPAIPNPGGFPVDGKDAQQQSTLPPPPTYAPGFGPNPPPIPSTPAPGYATPMSYQYDPDTQPVFSNIPGTPGNVNPQPRQDPGVDHQNLTIDGIRFGSQTAFDMALQRRMNRSFASYVLDEFGDMLHKADPHVAGLLAFRVYMDKVMR